MSTLTSLMMRNLTQMTLSRDLTSRSTPTMSKKKTNLSLKTLSRGLISRPTLMI
ncbi:organ-specific protein s2 [Phtheirospermum japonicum]|uniref:Organ-specific protein s2 n=1 Tax=Phtheirospermum japonicum TaxID=374723 RepID=A0A830CJY4_9LAMI|nr:organ-specific protein s2 [Phtheirospermum japonicum]